MSHNIRTETVIELLDAPKYVPGRKLGKATFRRWVNVGVVKRGTGGERVFLEAFRIGNVIHTSVEAIERFLVAQNDIQSSPVVTASQREREGRAAMRELAGSC